MESDQTREIQNITLDKDETNKKDNLDNLYQKVSSKEVEKSKDNINLETKLKEENNKSNYTKYSNSNEYIDNSLTDKNLDSENQKFDETQPKNKDSNMYDIENQTNYESKDGVKNNEFIIQNKNDNKNINIINNKQIEENNESGDSSSDEDEYSIKNYYDNNNQVYGLKNLGNNCYLNSGLQILAS